MITIRLIIIGLWAAFIVYWLVSAASAKPSLRTPELRRGAGMRLLIAILVIVVLRLQIAGHPGSYMVTSSPALIVAGLAITVAGMVFTIWARLHLGKNWGMPMTRKKEPELVTSGPYRWVRHPIYTGIIFGATGSMLATSWLGLVPLAAMGAYFIYSATREERMLRQQFPKEYPAYQAQSKMLIPFIF